MRHPEKSLLGIAAPLISGAGLQRLWNVLDGRATAHLHALAEHVATPGSFRAGCVVDLTLMFALQLFAAIGT
jgi:hypothetical protein